jgi:hypothetical protein
MTLRRDVMRVINSHINLAGKWRGKQLFRRSRRWRKENIKDVKLSCLDVGTDCSRDRPRWGTFLSTVSNFRVLLAECQLVYRNIYLYFTTAFLKCWKVIRNYNSQGNIDTSGAFLSLCANRSAIKHDWFPAVCSVSSTQTLNEHVTKFSIQVTSMTEKAFDKCRQDIGKQFILYLLQSCYLFNYLFFYLFIHSINQSLIHSFERL